MTRKDIFHDIVKNSLVAEGWVITHDPLYVKFAGVEVFVDLGAEHLLGAEKQGRRIAVEIKFFRYAFWPPGGGPIRIQTHCF